MQPKLKRDDLKVDIKLDLNYVDRQSTPINLTKKFYNQSNQANLTKVGGNQSTQTDLIKSFNDQGTQSMSSKLVVQSTQTDNQVCTNEVSVQASIDRPILKKLVSQSCQTSLKVKSQKNQTNSVRVKSCATQTESILPLSSSNSETGVVTNEVEKDSLCLNDKYVYFIRECNKSFLNDHQSLGSAYNQAVGEFYLANPESSDIPKVFDRVFFVGDYTFSIWSNRILNSSGLLSEKDKLDGENMLEYAGALIVLLIDLEYLPFDRILSLYSEYFPNEEIPILREENFILNKIETESNSVPIINDQIPSPLPVENSVPLIQTNTLDNIEKVDTFEIKVKKRRKRKNKTKNVNSNLNVELVCIPDVQQLSGQEFEKLKQSDVIKSESESISIIPNKTLSSSVNEQMPAHHEDGKFYLDSKLFNLLGKVKLWKIFKLTFGFAQMKLFNKLINKL
ncbi:unnamed protein product [Rotaria magnacalcarata]|nr:unnamed protein product [Rotaria magnacalcarata]